MTEAPKIKSEGLRIRHPSDLGDVIRNERQARDMSQNDLANFLGVSRKWLSNVENAKETAEIGKVLMVLRKLRIDLQVAKRPEPTADPKGFPGLMSGRERL